MADAREQILSDLRGCIAASVLEQRPILWHLNLDTSWVIRLPFPEDGVNRPSGRSRYNILLDPWLAGPQSDIATFFSTQTHTVPSAFETIAELNEALRVLEEAEIQVLAPYRPSRAVEYEGRGCSFIDAVAVSHEFTDHCHKATLEQVDPGVPVFAPHRAAKLIRSWNHFRNVITLQPFSPQNPDWHTTSHRLLPEFLGLSYLQEEGNSQYFHSAVLIAFDVKRRAHANSDTVALPSMDHESTTNRNLEIANSVEAIVYTPHGISPSALAPLPTSNPPIKTLALLHGLHDVSLPLKQLNLGAHNGLKAQGICKAKYWIGTHDEEKNVMGIIGPFLRRQRNSIDEAFKMAAKEQEVDLDEVMKGVQFSTLQLGESIML